VDFGSGGSEDGDGWGFELGSRSKGLMPKSFWLKYLMLIFAFSP